MTASQVRGALARRDLAIALTGAAVVLALGGVGVQRSRAVTLDRRAGEDQVVLAEVATSVGVEIERALWSVSDRARASSVSTMAGAPADVVAVSVSGGAEDVTTAEQRAPDVRAALDRARDTGEVVLGPWVERPSGAGPLAIAPVYTAAAGGGLPDTTAERRARVVGWVVEPVFLDRIIRAALPPSAAAAARDGLHLVTVGAAEVPERLPRRVLDAHGHQIELRAGRPTPAPIGVPTTALALSSIVLAMLIGGGLAAALRRLRTEQLDAADRSAQIQLIGDVGPLLQQSLELADVLPAIAVQLSDHFELAGVSLSTFTSGQAIDLFSFGEPPAGGVKPVLRPPAHLAAGETLVLALERGGRSVAQLKLVASRDLDGAELQSLRAITELVTAAVANASLYASQQEAIGRLRDLDALKTGFLGTASHELRTPVTAISGFATLLSESWDRFDDEQRRHFVDRIGSNARSLGAVVQDLLDFSLLDRGTIVLTVEDVDLGSLVRGVVERLSPVFGEHEIAFSSTPSSAIAADVNGLERVVSNLLTNAAKFSPPHTTITVTVGPSTVDGYGAEVVVCDEGPGIPREERKQVFTRFFRGSGEAVLRTRGVGIGLSVVAELVDLLHGDVAVDDAPGGGAQFTLRFPASAASSTGEEVAHASAP